MVDGVRVLSIKGEIVNVSQSDRKIPSLRFGLQGQQCGRGLCLDGRIDGQAPAAGRIDHVRRPASPRRPKPPTMSKFALPGSMKSAQMPRHDIAFTIDGHDIAVLFSETEIAAPHRRNGRRNCGASSRTACSSCRCSRAASFSPPISSAPCIAARLSPEVDFMILASYRSQTRSSGQVEVLRDIEADVNDRDVLLIDDILESGRTLAYAKDLIAARGAASVKTAVLLDKPGHLAADIKADFRGFVCPDKFVVGYGMDMAHQFRELPFVGHVVRA